MQVLGEEFAKNVFSQDFFEVLKLQRAELWRIKKVLSLFFVDT